MLGVFQQPVPELELNSAQTASANAIDSQMGND
jgi:hypothetical protein